VRTPPGPAADITATPPPQPVDELSYFDRLEKTTTPAEKLAKPDAAAKAAPPKESAPVSKEPVPAPKASASVVVKEPAAALKQEAARPQTARVEPKADAEARPPAAPAGAVGTKEVPKEVSETSDAATANGNFAVQVAALNVRSEADAMAKRLTSKGYSAYVLAAANGNPAVFRVRIGSYKTRREAEAMAARLQKEEQIKPWVTR
jgi:cell division septation protein DedD